MDVTPRGSPEPTAEEYSRVTNPERFRPLHRHALDLLARLEAIYDVHQREAFELVPVIMQPFEYARPPVTLTPGAPDAAPIAIAFTTFPSLIVRCGRWHAQPFPACGCDACAEDAVGEADRLEAIVGKVVAGQFAEELRIPLFGAARLAHTFLGGHPSEGWSGDGWTTIPRAVARALAGPGPRRVQWQPWPHRGRQARVSAPAV
jgi:hypothetical protein